MVLPTVAHLIGGERAPEVTSLLQSGLAAIGTRLVGSDEGSDSVRIRLIEGTAATAHLGLEGYHLVIDSSGLTISANSGAGLFYGAQSLLQLASSDGTHPATIPFVDIADAPEYRWRGIHLDVSRHFFSKKLVEQYIDMAARFKLNTFHWHLTDDQGWRLEVPAYPNLTRIGGCRSASQIGGFGSRQTDGLQSCGWYTEDDVREIVAFANKRHVTIVPEIEGPGHSVEVMAAYPELACDPGDYATLVYWGSTKYSLCPTDETFAFYDVIFRELSELFPGLYVHVGGDEVPYASWRDNPTILALMRRYNLKSYSDVQAYFTRRVESIAKKYNRRIVGWNEIEDSGVSTDAVIMAWTGSESGLAAAREGNDVVMTPDPPLYFDKYQSHAGDEPSAIGGLTTLNDVYDYDPATGFDGASARKHLLGAQGNVWTEYISTREHLWYMAYPRALALAELCWTPRARMSWPDFQRRVGFALSRLEPLGVSFRVPPVTFSKTMNGTALALSDIIPNAQIWYSVQGSPRGQVWKPYRKPLRMEATVEVSAVAAIPEKDGMSIIVRGSLQNLPSAEFDASTGS